MPLGPTLVETIARARADLRMGVPVVLVSGSGGVAVLAAEGLRQDRLEALRTVGPLVLAITARRAETLKARAYDGDLARIAVDADADEAWVMATADPASDLSSPMKGPFTTLRDGNAEAHRTALQLVKSARLLPAALVCDLADAAGFATANGLTALPRDLLKDTLTHLSPLHDIVSGRVPTSVAEQGRVHVFRPEDGGEEHFAVEIGRVDRTAPALVRLHSACFTGDVLGSLKCDCGPQLHAALTAMGQAGSGVLLYLNQEGRGIGLANKMRAYSLQDQGFDTVEANHRLGFEDDERDFRIGAAILREMGIGTVRLMTNNPAKVQMLESCDVKVVERVPLRVGRNPLNADYLDAKVAKSGHIP
ncbi:MAG: GTP cyclohydrolase II [Rhodobacteraceae bacterium]|nr:GTP cyclohydrolase II [Alphaproteobacteria bacterium]NNK65264.1 GTP cyclohydrolase II [Paracoccaceae bacterium]